MANFFFKECFLQGVYHYEALEIWDKLEIGQLLSLRLNAEKDRIVLAVKDGENNGKVVGELSDDDAKFIYDIIKAGHDNVFGGIIIYKSNETTDENKRLKAVIKIMESEK